MEEAQLMRRSRPDLGQHGWVHAGIVRDHLVGLDASRLQLDQKRLDGTLVYPSDSRA